VSTGGRASGIAALLIAIVSITLVGLRPGRIPAWAWAVGGAALVLAIGAEPPVAAARSVGAQWNVLLFIIGLMGISVAAESSGLFAWIADVVLERARGSRRRLFVWLFLSGAMMTALLSNDATAIVFTPIVFRAVTKRGIEALPYLYACTFVADTASFGLPFSNPANLLVLPRPQLIPFAAHLGVPMIAAVILNLGIFLALFRKGLAGDYALEPAPPLGPRGGRVLGAMAIVIAAYIVALTVDWPLGPVAASGAVLSLLAAAPQPLDVGRRIGWSTLALLGGLFIVVDAVARTGLFSAVLRSLRVADQGGRIGALGAAAFGSAAASNVLNNLPVAVISGTLVGHGHAGSLAYALVAGVDVGPNLTTAGSLATILWMSTLRERGVHVSSAEYLRLGLCVVPAILLVTTCWLWIVR
jgi:arsenical pump membrane protein